MTPAPPPLPPKPKPKPRPKPRRRRTAGVAFKAKEAQDVLSWVHIASVPQTTKELAELAEIDHSKVVVIVRKLEGKGLICRNRERGGRVSWSPNFER